MDDHEEKLMAVLVLLATCFLGIFFNGWSLLVIISNDKLSSAVRVYFIGDLAARIANYCIAVFFAAPCAFLFFCVESYDEFSVGWLINRICGYSKVSIMFSTKFFTLALALNRFFAVYRKGQYYQMAISYVELQFVVLVLLPFLLLSPLMLEQEAYYYYPDTFGWYYYGYWAELVMAHLDYDLTIVIWVLVIFFDSATAWSIRKLTVTALAKAGTTSVKKMDVQIMKQVCSFHAVSLTYFIFIRLFAMNRSFDHWSNLECFCFYDFIPAIIDMLAGISRVYYLRVPKSKKRETSISTVIEPAPPAFATKTRKSITRMTG